MLKKIIVDGVLYLGEVNDGKYENMWRVPSGSYDEKKTLVEYARNENIHNLSEISIDGSARVIVEPLSAGAKTYAKYINDTMETAKKEALNHYVNLYFDTLLK